MGTPFAGHLEDTGEILAAVRQVTSLAGDFAETGPLGSGMDRRAQDLRARHSEHVERYGAAAHVGIADADDARRLLRDAVNLALELRDCYARNGSGDPILLERAAEVQREFKPFHHRHYGLGVGDRVRVNMLLGRTADGEVVALDGMDNNRCKVLLDGDEKPFSTTCEHCDQMPTFGASHQPAPGSRM